MKQIVPVSVAVRIRVSLGVGGGIAGCGVPGAYGAALCTGRICYTARMFIHRVFITGRSDRGAWPWRKPVRLNT